MHSEESVCNIAVFSSSVLNGAVEVHEKVLASPELLAIWCSLHEGAQGFVICQNSKLVSSQLTFKKCRLLIIANNSFWKVGYLTCSGLNFWLWKQDGLIASRVPCPIHHPSPISLASHIRYFGSLDLLFQYVKICEEFTISFTLLKA